MWKPPLFPAFKPPRKQRAPPLPAKAYGVAELARTNVITPEQEKDARLYELRVRLLRRLTGNRAD